jgi:hypothetical protein
MPSVVINKFRGKSPRTGARLLGDVQALEALNCRITAGQLDPINGISLVYTAAIAAIKTLYRYRFGLNDNWLVFDTVVDVVRSPTSGDTLGRIYWTGKGEPRMSTYAAAISGAGVYPGAWFVLGVAAPLKAPVVNPVGGTAPTEIRAYNYTFVTALGEQSPPSPSVVVTGNQNATSFDLSGLSVAPLNAGSVIGALKDTPAAGQVTVSLGESISGTQAGDSLTFANVGGMTDLNGSFKVVSVDAVLNKVVVTLTTAQVWTAGGTWSRDAPHNIVGMRRRYYRTVGIGAVFKFCGESDAIGTTFSDTLPSGSVGESLPTLGSSNPPKDLHSLIVLPNGALAGISGNQLCMSEPYKPYSWPIANRYAFAGVGVALTSSGNSVMILTDGFPYVAVATTPDAASLAKIETHAPCVSKRGVVDTGAGAIYPSREGLWKITPSGAFKVSQSLYRFDEWSAITPQNFDATYWDGQYIARRPFGTTSRVLFVDLPEADGVTEIDYTVDFLYANPYDGLLYAVVGNSAYLWNGDNNNRLSMLWKSHDMQSSRPLNFGVAQIHAKFSDIVPVDLSAITSNTALMASAEMTGGSFLDEELLENALLESKIVEVAQVTPKTCQFTLIADGKIMFSQLITNSDPFTLPAGYLSEVTTMQINSNISVFSMGIATSMEELKTAAA